MEALNRKQLRPFEHPWLIRLGPRKDGGYVVPEGQVRNATVLLSLGISRDWSFDNAFVGANPGVRVIGVDRSVGRLLFIRQIVVSLLKILRYSIQYDRRKIRKSLAALRNALGYFSFFAGPHRHIRKMVSVNDSASEIRVARLLEIAGVARGHGVFLKMDVEGSEYALIPDIVNFEGRINCIVAEFHSLSRKTAIFNRSVAQLLEHFRIVHIHGNNYSPHDLLNDFPGSVEVTLVNKALIDGSLTPCLREYPRVDLDYPNNPRRPDYRLRFD